MSPRIMQMISYASWGIMTGCMIGSSIMMFAGDYKAAIVHAVVGIGWGISALVAYWLDDGEKKMTNDSQTEDNNVREN